MLSDHRVWQQGLKGRKNPDDLFTYNMSWIPVATIGRSSLSLSNVACEQQGCSVAFHVLHVPWSLDLQQKCPHHVTLTQSE